MSQKAVRTYPAKAKGKKRKSKDEKEYTVESILDVKVKEGQKWFLVKWKGWDQSHNTWEPECNMVGCSLMVKNFFISRKRKDHEHVDFMNDATNEPQPERERLIVTIRNPMAKAQTVNYQPPAKMIKSGPPILKPMNQPLDKSAWKEPTSYRFRTWVPGGESIMTFDLTAKEQVYTLMLSEDIQNLEPLFVYGISKSTLGHPYCIIQFKDRPFVDVVRPPVLFKCHPYVKQYFQMFLSQAGIAVPPTSEP